MESLGCAGASEEAGGFAGAFGLSPAKEDTQVPDTRSPVSRWWLHLALAGFGQTLQLPPFPRASPGTPVAPLCSSRLGMGGRGKAGRCRTPLPSPAVRHRFPSQPWELPAGRCSSSRAASSSPSACSGRGSSTPAPHPAFHPGAGAHWAGCSQAPHPRRPRPPVAPSAWVWRKTQVLCPRSGTYPGGQRCLMVHAGSSSKPLLPQ